MAEEKLYDLIAELIGDGPSNVESLGKTGQKPEPEAPPIQTPPLEAPKPIGKSLTESLESIGKTAKETGGAAKEFAESDFGKGAMIAASGLAAVAAAAIAIPKVISSWSESLVESKKGLMAFNGVIAGVILRAEQRQIERGIESGRRTAGSTKFLSQGLEDLKDELQGARDDLFNVIAVPLGVMIRLITTGVKFLKIISGYALWEMARDLFVDGDGSDASIQRFMQRVKDGEPEKPNQPAEPPA